jgi:ApaG protein
MITNIQSEIKLDFSTSFAGRHLREAGNMFLFNCCITVKNLSQSAIRLTGKHWFIYTNSKGPDEIIGLGFSGENPVLLPDGDFVYHSLLPLHTVFATLEPHYQIEIVDTGEAFDICVPSVSLIPIPFLN